MIVAGAAWPEVEKEIAAGAVSVLPIGAAAKEHGRHLPLASDWIQAESLARRLEEHAHILVWPTLGYGFYPAFVDYPGSCTLDSVTFESMVEQIVESIFRSGAPGVLILNTGISTIAPLESLAGPLRHRIRLAHVYCGERYARTEREVCLHAKGGHGDEAETSIMLAIAPEQVRMGEARAWESSTMGPGKFVRSDASHPNFSPDGIYGDPTVANREKGEKLLGAMLEDLLNALADLRNLL